MQKQTRLALGVALGAALLFISIGCSLPAFGRATATLAVAPAALNIASSTLPAPSATATITVPPSSTPTATASATPLPTLHPMQILAARQTPYPGSAITIEETLEPGDNYSRYIAWYESKGLKIYGLLTVPYGEMPASGWPAIVFNHGYIPPDQYHPTERYIAYVDSLARSGYIVYRIDYRGHDRSDGEANGAFGFPGYTVDVLNAVSALQAFLRLMESGLACGGIRWAVI